MEIDHKIKPIEKETPETSLELLKFTAQVQSRIKDDISSDFVLATLDERSKEGIIELTTDAYFAKRLIGRIARVAYKYEWDEKEGIWYKRELNKIELKQLQISSDYVFDAYMNRLFMTVNLNRNVDKNHILNLLAGNLNQEIGDIEFDNDNEIKKAIRGIGKGKESKLPGNPK